MDSTTHRSKRSIAVNFAALALSLPAAVQAQQTILEEIIVTAQKRVENVQDIPVTISVVTGETLDIFSIRDTNDLANSVPGLVIQATPQNLSQITIRGLGTGAGGESLDQSVGLFIDGIWAGRLREFQAALFDVERVEVIKGTQSTLLGKNTSLGANSILSRRPHDEFGGHIEGDFEFSWGHRSVEIDGFCGCCNPVNIAVLPGGGFVTCEKGLVRVKIYNSDGEFQNVVAGPAQLVRDGDVRVCDLPEECQSGGFDVAIDRAGRVYVLDTIKNVVRVFTRMKGR